MKVGKKFGKTGLMSLLGLMGVLVTEAALAQQGIGGVARNISNSLNGVLELLYLGAYLGGAACGLMAAVKLKAHNDNPQQTPMKTPVVLFVVCAILVALPSFLQTSEETVWGGGAKSSADRAGIQR